jgi:hypothetical protein
MNKTLSKFMSLDEVAKRLGCEVWQVRRVFEKKLLPPAHRIGMYRVVEKSELPRIRAALVKAGYLKK